MKFPRFKFLAMLVSFVIAFGEISSGVVPMRMTTKQTSHAIEGIANTQALDLRKASSAFFSNGLEGRIPRIRTFRWFAASVSVAPLAAATIAGDRSPILVYAIHGVALCLQLLTQQWMSYMAYLMSKRFESASWNTSVAGLIIAASLVVPPLVSAGTGVFWVLGEMIAMFLIDHPNFAWFVGVTSFALAAAGVKELKPAKEDEHVEAESVPFDFSVSFFMQAYMSPLLFLMGLSAILYLEELGLLLIPAWVLYYWTFNFGSFKWAEQAFSQVKLTGLEGTANFVAVSIHIKHSLHGFRYRFVYRKQEPYALPWAGKLFPSPVWVIPLEDWTPLMDRIFPKKTEASAGGFGFLGLPLTSA